MPSVINSDNGVISGTSGLKTSGSNDGLLDFQSNGTRIAGITTSAFQVGTDNISAVNSMGFRNRIINGDMRIDQRNAGASVTPTAADTYLVDRWVFGASQSSKASFQRVTTAPTGFPNSFLATSLSAYTVGASEVFHLQQQIEGFNVADLGWGAAGAQTVTLSFWVRSSLTGTFGGALSNSAVNRSYPFTFTISAANTFEYKTITIAGDTSGTWLTDNSCGIRLFFGLGVGSTKSGTAGVWAGADYRSATGAVSVVGTNGATFYITGVQLEAGSVATPFERRDYGRELIMCQRYYEVGGSYQLFSGYVENANIYYLPIRFSVTKRAAPSVTPTYVAASRFPASAPTASNVQVDGFYTQATSNLTGTGYYQFSWTASAEL